jgi:hypothetical protein
VFSVLKIVRQKITDAGETFDGVDFVQHRHGQNAADSGDTLQTKKRIGIVELGVLFEIQVELLNLFIVEVDEIHVETHHSLQAVAFEAFGNAVLDRFARSGKDMMSINPMQRNGGSSRLDMEILLPPFASVNVASMNSRNLCTAAWSGNATIASEHLYVLRSQAVRTGPAVKLCRKHQRVSDGLERGQ